MNFTREANLENDGNYQCTLKGGALIECFNVINWGIFADNSTVWCMSTFKTNKKGYLFSLCSEFKMRIVILRRINLFTFTKSSRSTAVHAERRCLCLDFFSHSSLPFQTKSSLMAAVVQHKSSLSYECYCSTDPNCTKSRQSGSKAESLLPSIPPYWGSNMMLICWAELQTIYAFLPPPPALLPVPHSAGFSTEHCWLWWSRVEKLTRGGRITLCI